MLVTLSAPGRKLAELAEQRGTGRTAEQLHDSLRGFVAADHRRRTRQPWARGLLRHDARVAATSQRGAGLGGAQQLLQHLVRFRRARRQAHADRRPDQRRSRRSVGEHRAGQDRGRRLTAGSPMPTPSPQERTDTFAGDSAFARATTGPLTADPMRHHVDQPCDGTPARDDARPRARPTCSRCSIRLIRRATCSRLCSARMRPRLVPSRSRRGGRRTIALSAALLPSPARADQQQFLATGRLTEALARRSRQPTATHGLPVVRLGGTIAHDLE